MNICATGISKEKVETIFEEIWWFFQPWWQALTRDLRISVNPRRINANKLYMEKRSLNAQIIKKKNVFIRQRKKKTLLSKSKNEIYDWLSKTIRDKSNGMPFLSHWEEKLQLPIKILYSVKIFFKNEGELKMFSASL